MVGYTTVREGILLKKAWMPSSTPAGTPSTQRYTRPTASGGRQVALASLWAVAQSDSDCTAPGAAGCPSSMTSSAELLIDRPLSSTPPTRTSMLPASVVVGRVLMIV